MFREMPVPGGNENRVHGGIPSMHAADLMKAGVGLVNPGEDNLAGFAGFHDLEALLEVSVVQAVGDDGGDIEPGAQHGIHLLPGAEHFTAVDAFHLEPFPDEGVPVDAGAAWLDAEQGDIGSVCGVGDDVLEAGWCSAHFKAYSVAFCDFKVFAGGGDAVAGEDIDGAVCTHGLGEFKFEVAHVGDGDGAGTCLLADRRRHGANETCASDEDVLTHEIPGESGMGGVAQGIENGGNLHGHILVDADDVALRNGQVLSEATGAVDANAHGVRAEVEESFAAVAAMTADDMPLAGDHITRLVLGYGRAHALNDTAEFMPYVHADRNGLLSPGIPVPDVEVCAADGGFVNFDKYIIGTDFRHRYIHQFQTGAGRCFDEGFHFGPKLYSCPAIQASQISVSAAENRVCACGGRLALPILISPLPVMKVLKNAARSDA